jgi:uncharacterized membrane protein YhaH (DUF805 family)
MERLRDLLRFDGRLSRLGYWRRYLTLAITGALVWGVALMGSLAVGVWAAVLFLPLFPILVASLAMGVRRLHDRNRSGWWLVVFMFLPGVLMGLVEGKATQASTVLLYLAALLAALVVIIWGFVEIGCRRGTRGDNRFGAEPAVGG